jgi:hypothetical protein
MDLEMLIGLTGPRQNLTAISLHLGRVVALRARTLWLESASPVVPLTDVLPLSAVTGEVTQASTVVAADRLAAWARRMRSLAVRTGRCRGVREGGRGGKL